MIEALVFYLFSTVAVISAVMVISSKNPVHSVLFLILAFFNAAGLFVLLGAEFLAMILVIVYVGAVAVLFLFVVMMLNIHVEDLRKGIIKHLPFSLLIGLVFLIELVFVLSSGEWKKASNPVLAPDAPHNTQALGNVLYTDYVLLFQGAGLILFVAMIGSIVLTLRQRDGVKRQSISRQVNRTRADSVEIKKVKSRNGI